MLSSNITEFIKTVHGSRLYGLETDSSDWDYKGIFLQNDKKEIIFGRAPDTQTVKTDTEDTTYFSIQKFFQMVFKGDMVSIDMLHTPKDKVVFCSMPSTWDFIRNNRQQFYTKEMRAYLGFVKSQSIRYGRRGDRLGFLQLLRDVLDGGVNSATISDISEILPIGEFSEFVWIGGANHYKIFDKTYVPATKVGELKRHVDKMIDRYGNRAHKCVDGNDWKAMSHALRACYQLIDMYTIGDIIFPFTGHRKEILMDVRMGDASPVAVSELLDELTSEVEELSRKSTYPEKIDPSGWEDFVVELMLLEAF